MRKWGGCREELKHGTWSGVAVGGTVGQGEKCRDSGYGGGSAWGGGMLRCASHIDILCEQALAKARGLVLGALPHGDVMKAARSVRMVGDGYWQRASKGSACQVEVQQRQRGARGRTRGEWQMDGKLTAGEMVEVELSENARRCEMVCGGHTPPRSTSLEVADGARRLSFCYGVLGWGAR